MTKVGDLVENARVLLQDNGVQLRISSEQIVRWYNEGLLKASEVDPFFVIDELIHVCTASAEQEINAGIRLLAINHRVNGGALFRVGVDLLNREDPDWRAASPSAAPFHWAFHADPKRFWVYPVPTTSVILNCTVQAQPTPATRLSDTAAIPSELVPAMTDYIAYRGLMGDAENVDNQALAGEYYARFEAALTRHSQREAQRFGLL